MTSSTPSSTEHLVNTDYDHSACLCAHLHSGEPKGQVLQIAGANAYVARPSADNTIAGAAIVIVTDLFGYELKNTRLIADKFAADGLLTIVPDLFNGEALQPDTFEPGRYQDAMKEVVLPWLARHGDAVTLPQLKAVFQELRAADGAWRLRKLGAIGYCYGGRYSVLISGESVAADVRADACGAAHPSRIAVPADLQRLTVPSLWILAEIDHAFTKADVAQMNQIVVEKKANLGLDYEIHEYAGTTHGFAARGSETDPIVAKAMADAAHVAAQFFKNHLA